jgi:hypothetical protein
MVFCHKLVFLGLTLVLLAHSVSGGPAVGTVCVATCNAAWVACVAGITASTWGTGFFGALATCNSLQQACFGACAILCALPTP